MTQLRDPIVGMGPLFVDVDCTFGPPEALLRVRHGALSSLLRVLPSALPLGQVRVVVPGRVIQSNYRAAIHPTPFQQPRVAADQGG